MKYYTIENNLNIPERWYLWDLVDRNGTEFDSRVFTYGQRVDLSLPLRLPLDATGELTKVTLPLQVNMSRKGKPLDFTFGSFDTPIVTERVAELLCEVAASDIQRVPVRVESQSQGYEMINVISMPDCIDTDRSEIEWWTEEDEQPDKLGTIRMLGDLIVDERRAAGHALLRPAGWEVRLVASEKVKEVLEKNNVTGIQFKLVT